MVRSEKASEIDLKTVGECCGTISAGGMSKYDLAEGTWAGDCIDEIDVGVETSFLRQLRDC